MRMIQERYWGLGLLTGSLLLGAFPGAAQSPEAPRLAARWKEPGTVPSVAWLRSGRSATLSGSEVRLYEELPGSPSRRFAADPPTPLQDLDVSRDGRSLAAVSERQVLLWSLATSAAPQTLPAEGLFLQSVALSPDGRRVAAGGMDHPASTSAYARDSLVRIWDRETGKVLRTLRAPRRPVGQIDFSPDGRWLAAASGHEEGDQAVKLWDTHTGRLRLLRGHPDSVLAVAFSPDGRHLASGDGGGEIRYWDLRTGRSLRRFRGHSTAVGALAFRPGGAQLVSSSVQVEGQPDSARPGEVALWDLRAGRKLWASRPTFESLPALAVSMDGIRLAAGAQDGSVFVWTLPRNGRSAR